MDLQIIKIGSANLFNNGRIDCDILGKLVSGIEDYTEKYGTKSILVVSGAVPLGKDYLNEKKSNKELSLIELQSYASIGQPHLINLYSSLFSNPVSQILFTDNDLEDNFNVVKDVMYNLLQKNIIPLLNYNDATDPSEVRLDNDFPSALLGVKCNAKRVIMYGIKNGFYDKNDNLIEKINNINSKLYTYCNGTSLHGTGGCEPKLHAADYCMRNNIDLIMANRIYSLENIIKENYPKTIFTQN
jgi:glutamate 5-kinase